MLKYSGEVKKCIYFAIFLDYNHTTNYSLHFCCDIFYFLFCLNIPVASKTVF